MRPAVERFTRHGVEFVDGRSEEFDAVILATGYKSNVPCWLKVPNIALIDEYIMHVRSTYQASSGVAGEGVILGEGWVPKEAIPERVERGQRALCRRLHEAWLARSIAGCMEDRARHRATL